MSKYLVVVESPTKAKTIATLLGKEFEVVSSKGHIVDLPARRLSVKIEEGFLPQYTVIPGKEKILGMLKERAQDKEIIYIATDPDREGEAIGWHIKNKLNSGDGKSKKKDKRTDKGKRKFCRVIFHEITEDAVREAFSKPRDIDYFKVNAQQARRVLDRVVGYFLSPLLWKKVTRGLSAGRVQSVALKFIVVREKEITAFVSTKSYGVEAQLEAGTHEFTTRLLKFQKKKAPFPKKEEAHEIIDYVKDKPFIVEEIQQKEIQKKPQPPFTTSLLQQDAFNKLGFSSQKTMLLAQKLYEGVQIKDQMVGLITYMRTDSFFVSDKARKGVKEYITTQFGPEFLPKKEHRYKEKKNVQGAHEAIRPTSIKRHPESVKGFLSPDAAQLYELIWKRFLASCMEKAKYKTTKVIISAGEAAFCAEARVIMFEGYQKVMARQEEKRLPCLKEQQEVAGKRFELTEHITKPPPRLTDATLVKELEEKGIGRPSTYAPTLATIIKRNYARRERGQFIPTDLGIRVCELLLEHFTEIMDEAFTAQVEEKLDAIEEGTLEWKALLEEFYPPFKEKIDKASKIIQKHVEYTQEKCPLCSRFLVVKWSRKGRFLSCSGFPECKFAKSITTGVVCPACQQGELIERRNKKGQRFYGCTCYPECTHTSRNLPKEEEKDKPSQLLGENDT